MVVKGEIYYQTACGESDHITIVGCISEEGKAIPDTLIFKGKSFPTFDIRGLDVCASTNGWVDANLKKNLFENFS